ncbi:VOC family protein [Mycolicibacterium brumae]|uniref:Glyoxalase n=1 Tax=Mycolicibacterium brumae TaxID=85968 RepID=A0A2G5P994_9MYCO|nr:VOC family protein [Mycolicibacterium brumae]MCV7193939.1 VOC family protein [Mycolicibacterium brumae]PIB74895.1 glyoxalase [Mycolicibacterium brumae]RWA22486.1 hypothetical protein MBRU_12960 [Mycolicibacterium brumae DSM 44177]UWW07987.1 VOC family protein [Mycolicibacterium brumae]
MPNLVGGAGIRLQVGAGDTAAYTALLGSGADGRWSVGADCLALTDGPSGVLFATPDVDGAARLLARRGLPTAAADGGTLRLVDHPVLGVCPAEALRPTSGGAVRRIDHVVVSAPDERDAIALFGGCLGLDFRLVRALDERITQLFFRCGDTVVEAVVDSSKPSSALEWWGIAWRADDIDRARRMLCDAGMDVSEVRAGRKPGTRVATVREPALGTPTLLIEHRQQPGQPGQPSAGRS